VTRKTEGSFGLGVMLLLLAANLAAQVPPDLAAERAGYLAWLKTAPNSPLSAVAQQRVGEGVRLGPAEADIPLAGIEEYRVYPSGGGLVLEGAGGKRPFGRGRGWEGAPGLLRLRRFAGIRRASPSTEESATGARPGVGRNGSRGD
jgi:hypothetical protein